MPNKEQVFADCKYYGIKADELLLAWLSDKIVDDVQNEPCKEALKVAEKKLNFLKRKENEYGIKDIDYNLEEK